jgi:hypothetical protein
MVRFSRVMFGLCCALIVLVGTARAVGQQQTLSQPLEQLRLTSCNPPCWLNIVPGQTTIGEVLQRLGDANHRPADYTGQLTVGLALKEQTILASEMPVAFRFTGGVTDEISLLGTFATNGSSFASMPSVGELISVIGLPSCAVPTGKTWTLIYDDPRGVVEVKVMGSSLEMTQWVYFIRMHRATSVKACASLPDWHGFARREKYTR